MTNLWTTTNQLQGRHRRPNGGPGRESEQRSCPKNAVRGRLERSHFSPRRRFDYFAAAGKVIARPARGQK